MQKFLTDVHTHSAFSCDGEDELQDMLAAAQRKGVAFYGVSEHFDYDLLVLENRGESKMIDAAEYFHAARHLQEDYEGVMNVLIGAEFGYIDDERAFSLYRSVQEKYRPDFIVNSVHTVQGEDYYYKTRFYKDGKLRTKEDAYGEYLATIRKSLDAPYGYDIVGHIGYAARYAPYADKDLRYEDFAAALDDILIAIIEKDKILEINSSTKRGISVTDMGILKRYFKLGGRKISYASDAHNTDRICEKREEIVRALKQIGFTHCTVPCKGEHIQVEL